MKGINPDIILAEQEILRSLKEGVGCFGSSLSRHTFCQASQMVNLSHEFVLLGGQSRRILSHSFDEDTGHTGLGENAGR
jgi:hypothetical protein